MDDEPSIPKIESSHTDAAIRTAGADVPIVSSSRKVR